jgi:hypothetical protein
MNANPAFQHSVRGQRHAFISKMHMLAIPRPLVHKPLRHVSAVAVVVRRQAPSHRSYCAWEALRPRTMGDNKPRCPERGQELTVIVSVPEIHFTLSWSQSHNGAW